MVYCQLNSRFIVSRSLVHQLNRRFASGAETNRRGGFGKFFLYATSAASLGVCGAVGFAYFDPKFRKEVEKNVPGTSYVFTNLFGTSAAETLPVSPQKRKESINDKTAFSTALGDSSRNIPPPLYPTTLNEAEKLSSEKMEKNRVKNKEELTKLVEEMLDHKLSLLTSAQQADLSGKVQLAKSEFEEELRKELARQSSAQATHEEQLLRSQRENLNLQHKKELHAALLKERQEYTQKLSEAIAQLTALDVFLNGRAEFDSQNRRAKKLWISCQNLKNLLCKNAEIQPENSADPHAKRSLASVIADVQEAGQSDNFVKLLLTSTPEHTLNAELYTEDDLMVRYEKVKTLSKRFARIGNDGGNIFQYFLSYLQSIFIWDNEKDTFGSTQIDPKKISVYELLSRTSYCLKNKDYESAIRLMALLEGEPARISSDWLADLRNHMEIKQLADLLIAHASAQSIRSLY